MNLFNTRLKNIGKLVLRHLKSADFQSLPPEKLDYFKWLSFQKSAGQERSKYSALLRSDGSVRDHFLYGGEGRMDADVQPVLEVVPGVVLLGLKQQ